MRRALIALTVAVGLTVTGCAATTGTSSEPAESTPTAAPTAAARNAAPESTPTESRPAHWGDYTAEEFYLASLAGTWQGDGEPTADEWLALGKDACARIAAGESEQDVHVIDGQSEEDAWNNDHIVGVALDSLCYDGKH